MTMLDDLANRIAEKVTVTEIGCHLWNGGLSAGAPSMWLDGKPTPVRRVVWALAGNNFADRVFSGCGTPRCVKLEHLTTKKPARHDVADAVDWSFAGDKDWMDQFLGAVKRTSQRYKLEHDEVFSEGCLWASVHINPNPLEAAQRAAQQLVKRRDKDEEMFVSLDDYQKES